MLTFFRHKRKSILNSGQARKYILYAIGEIALVVIGILIALQINNWNEERKKTLEEKVVLTNLQKGLYQAKAQSEDHISLENNLKERLQSALGISAVDTLFEIDAITDSLFFEIFWMFESNIPVIGSYNDIKNTGKSALISNAAIRENVANLELRLNRVFVQVADRLSVQQIRIDEIAENDLNFVRLLKVRDHSIYIDKEVPNNYNLILSDPRIRNLLAIKLDLTYSVLEERQNLHSEILELIQQIEEELEDF